MNRRVQTTALEHSARWYQYRVWRDGAIKAGLLVRMTHDDKHAYVRGPHEWVEWF